MTLTREEWQEGSAGFIDSVTEAEQDLRDRNELIRLMGEIIYKQAKIIKNACAEDGSPRVNFTPWAGIEWQYDIVGDDYIELTEGLMPQLPDDWTETLEV